MSIGKRLLLGLGLAAATLLGACSSSSGGPAITITGASQDLGADATGVTMLVTFSQGIPGTTGPANFEADGGQIALNVVVVGNQATVTWDSVVNTTHQVRAVGIPNTVSVYGPITSTDSSPSTFTITAGTQIAGLGGDTATIQFAGANVVEADAEDITNWTLTVNGQSMDLTGSVFDLDPVTQILSITFGTMANLHAAFSLQGTGIETVAGVAIDASIVVGAATGDTTAPTFVSAVQNLTEDEFGRVIDYTFDEAMDPVFSIGFASFDAGFPTLATQVQQPSDAVLRVTYTDPVIPALDTIDLSSLMDAHGNAYVDTTEAVTAGSTVANAFDGAGPVLDTVENQGLDTITATFVQAIDPDSAEDFDLWRLESPTGTPVDLSGATFSYDFLTKSLTVTLAQDLVTGQTFLFGADVAAPQPLDVDGEDFLVTFGGTVTGDVTAPSVTSITQNRTFDPTGMTFDVQLSEDVDATQAQTAGNYVPSGGQTTQTATLLGSLDTVRIVLDTLAVPGDVTMDVSNLVDLAGNALGTQATIALGTDDATAPAGGSPAAFAFEGSDNDTVTVVFDDDMIQSEVEDPNNWVFEAPVGSPLDTTNATVAYDGPSKQAVLTFDGGDDVFVKNDLGFEVRFVTMRDIAGNVVDATALAGTVDGERRFPTLESAWVETIDPSSVHVQFDEPCDELDDIGLFTSYVFRDGGGFVIGTPSSVTPDADRMGATLSLGFGVTAGTHTIDVRGVTDLAGNQMFPVETFAISSEDANEPAFSVGISTLTAVSGEKNDVFVAEFDRPMSGFGLTDAANWSLTDGGTPADLSLATFTFDGTDTVTIDLEGPNNYDLQFGSNYTIQVDSLRSSQGIAMTAPSNELVGTGGDSTAPVLLAGRARLDAADSVNSVLIELDEAVDPTDAADTSTVDVLGVNPDTLVLVGPRTVRGTWSGGVSAGQVVNVTIADRAGNSGLTSQAIQAADTVGPIVTFVQGVSVAGFGGDRVEVIWNEPVDPATGLDLANYTVTENALPVDLTGAVASYDSGTQTVAITLASGVEFTMGNTINVVVDNVLNHAGLGISPPANINGSIVGDSTAPGFDMAFVNYRINPFGITFDVRFDEDVDPAVASLVSSYAFPGGQSALQVTQLADDVYRVSVDAVFAPGDTVEMTGVADPAGNQSGLISAPIGL